MEVYSAGFLTSEKNQIENKVKNQPKLFGRNKFNNSVIFFGNNNDIGKIIKVKIESTNQNTLFWKDA